jgi:hypothetical protein
MKIATICLIYFLSLNINFTIEAQTCGFNLNESASVLPHIAGTPGNADYLYVTAGSRLYCIGNQAGAFPEVGFHVPGQMGGIWQQPIKLLDGFRLNIRDHANGEIYRNVCDSFITRSFVTEFSSHLQDQQVRILQTQFVPDNLPVLAVEYQIQNTF